MRMERGEASDAFRLWKVIIARSPAEANSVLTRTVGVGSLPIVQTAVPNVIFGLSIESWSCSMMAAFIDTFPDKTAAADNGIPMRLLRISPGTRVSRIESVELGVDKS